MSKVGLRSLTTRALKWSTLGTFLQVVLQTGVVAVLGRLLSPAEYGLLAMANVFIQFSGIFSQMGLGPALIQREEIQEEDIRACFTLAVALGIAFTAVTILVAPLAEIFFKNEFVGSVVRWLSLSFVLGGFSLTATSLLRREMRFKEISLIELFAFGLGNGAVAICFAALGFGVWSLVIGILSQQIIILLASFFIVRHSLNPIFSPPAYRKSLRYGAHYSVNSMLDFLYAKVEVLFIGRFYSERLLGLYDRAYRLTNMPVELMAASITKVMFPAFSKLQEQQESLSRVFLTTFFVIGLLASGICAGMVPAGREIVLVVLGSQWQEAILPLQILAFALSIHYLIHIEGVLLDGTGLLAARSKTRIYGTIVKVIILAISTLFGFHGVLVGIGVSLVFQMALMSFYVIRRTGIPVRSFMSSCFLLIANAAFIGGLTWCVTFSGRALDLAPIFLLILQMAIGAVSLFISFSVALRYSLCGLRIEDFSSIPFVGRVFAWQGGIFHL